MKCLYPPCNREASVRGLCDNCYVTASLVVSFGLKEWEELELMGKVNKPKNPNKLQPRFKGKRKLLKWLLT